MTRREDHFTHTEAGAAEFDAHFHAGEVDDDAPDPADLIPVPVGQGRIDWDRLAQYGWGACQ